MQWMSPQCGPLSKTSEAANSAFFTQIVEEGRREALHSWKVIENAFVFQLRQESTPPHQITSEIDQVVAGGGWKSKESTARLKVYMCRCRLARSAW